jgi:hypothetical protein
MMSSLCLITLYFDIVKYKFFIVVAKLKVLTTHATILCKNWLTFFTIFYYTSRFKYFIFIFIIGCTDISVASTVNLAYLTLLTLIFYHCLA